MTSSFGSVIDVRGLTSKLASLAGETISSADVPRMPAHPVLIAQMKFMSLHGFCLLPCPVSIIPMSDDDVHGEDTATLIGALTNAASRKTIKKERTEQPSIKCTIDC